MQINYFNQSSCSLFLQILHYFIVPTKRSHRFGKQRIFDGNVAYVRLASVSWRIVDRKALLILFRHEKLRSIEAVVAGIVAIN